MKRYKIHNTTFYPSAHYLGWSVLSLPGRAGRQAGGGRRPEACECDNSLQIACIMLKLYIDVLYIKVSDEFDIDLCVTF